jgi:hypothetical protein
VLDELSERVCKTYSIFYKEIWYRYWNKVLKFKKLQH